jgi:hypothetical protein
MIGLGLSIGWKDNSRGGGSAYDSDYQAVLNRAVALGYTLPSASQQIKQNQLVLSLKAGGVWTKLDVLYIFANDGGSNFATLNWKAPTLNQASLIDTPTFTTNEGFTGNGITSYISTNFNPAIGTNNYVLNNASRYIYTLNAVGIFDGLELSQSNRITTSGTAQRINQGTGTINSPYSFSTGTGMKSIHRTSSTNVELFSGTNQASRTSTSNAVLLENQLISRSLLTYSANKVSMYAMGASLVSENTAFVNAFNTYIYNINNLDSDYVAVLNRAVTLGYALPTFSQIIKQNNLVLSLKAGGIWNKLDVLYIFANDGGSDFATLNWKSPSANQSTLINTPTFTANEGFIGNGTSSYINTNYTPSTVGNNYQLNDCSFGYWAFSGLQTGGTRVNVGTRNSSLSGLAYPVGGSENTLFINTNNTLNGNLSASSSNLGLRHFNRASSSGSRYYNSTGLVGSNTNISFDISNFPFFVSAINTANTPSLYTITEISIMFAGSSLATENTALNNAFNTYITSL